ncbi:carbohydrate-binding protein [Microbacterium sp. X-17]|uniref:chitinase n=1 Tax=Microbacterium sp. X-17 TaxID=3144404 RepID=UPI0031F5834C
MKSRIAYVSQPSPGPYDGKRLSPWRVLLGILILAAIVAAAIFGYRFFANEQVRGDVSAPWFAPYVDVTVTPTYAFEKPANNADLDVVLAFVVAQSATSCTPSWGAAYTMDEAAQNLDLDRRIQRLRNQGGDVVVSFGGAANTELAKACTQDAALQQAYASVIDRYAVSTIDLDIEQGNLTDPVAGLRRAVTIAAVQKQMRAEGKPLAVWLTLPVSPSGLTADGQQAVTQMLQSGVDLAGVNAMTMDYGTNLGGQSMAQVSISALRATERQLSALYQQAGTSLTDATVWAKLGATPMIGQNDVSGEVFTIDDAQQLNSFAQSQHLGRMSMWSLNRDRACGTNYADPTVVSNQCSGVDQGDTTFAQTLQPGFTAPPDASADKTTTPEASPVVTDNPSTSPYPIWSADATYLSGAKVVWKGNVYQAKWWTRGDNPDSPLANADSWPWKLIGPVLPGETPYPQPTLAPGTYPAWDPQTVYTAGNRIMFQGVPYEAKWWTRGDNPAAQSTNPDGSPWIPLTAKQIEDINSGASPAVSPTPAPPAG